MGTYPTQRNLGLAPMDPARALAPRPHSGPYGPAYGRFTPWQTETISMRILAEVAENVFSQDDAGIAYPGGQLWIRTYSLSSGQADGDYDDDGFWIAVPTTLPAGYTAVPWRNNRGSGGSGFDLTGAFQLDDGFSPQIFYPNFTPAKPIRLADGPYTPICTTVDPVSGTRRFIAGPCNIRGAVGSLNLGGLFGGLALCHISYHPGWRNVRLTVTTSAAVYATIPPGTSTTITVDGSPFTIGKSDLVLSGSIYSAFVDTGPISLAAAGAVKRTSIEATAGFAVALSIQASPRIDIPAPFWSSYGNLIAPGGLAAGTVPGY